MEPHSFPLRSLPASPPFGLPSLARGSFMKDFGGLQIDFWKGFSKKALRRIFAPFCALRTRQGRSEFGSLGQQGSFLSGSHWKLSFFCRLQRTSSIHFCKGKASGRFAPLQKQLPSVPAACQKKEIWRGFGKSRKREDGGMNR